MLQESMQSHVFINCYKLLYALFQLNYNECKDYRTSDCSGDFRDLVISHYKI